MLRKLFDSPWVYFTLAGILLVLTLVSQFEPVSVEAPAGVVDDIATLDQRDDLNVIFIVIDTLRADRLSSWGYHRQTSPNLDALVARGIRFAHTESQSSWTKTSMASLWTGMYPERTGVTGFANALPEEAVMPAEIFKEAGFRTGGVWRNGWVANNFGFDQGFDLYVKPAKNRHVGKVRRHNPSASSLQGTDADATESAIEYIVGAGSNRFFLYIHYMDIHQYLYADSSPEWGSQYTDIYDMAIHWTDRNVGMLVEALQQQGLLGRTMIVIAVDHGEAFYEHGSEGHARDLYREVLEVPFIIVPPFSLSPGIVVEERVANVDVWPTVLDMLGLSPMPGAEGKSLVPLIMAAGGVGEPPSELMNRDIYAQLDKGWGQGKERSVPMVSVRTDGFRMIRTASEEPRQELYDHSTDPGEKKNVASSDPETAERLLSSIDAFLAIPRTQWAEAPEIEIDEMRKAQLRALGYVLPGTKEGRAQRRKAVRESKRKQAAAQEDGGP